VSVQVESIAPVREGLFSVDPPSLIGARCLDCGALRFPVAGICAACQSTNQETVPLSGAGSVYSHTVVHARPPGYLGEAPYAYGIVELPEGLRVTATLLADDLGRIEIGAPCAFELMTLPGPDGPLRSYAYRVAQ
jgi:uncharacterized OB-fold protein